MFEAPEGWEASFRPPARPARRTRPCLPIGSGSGRVLRSSEDSRHCGSGLSPCLAVMRGRATSMSRVPYSSSQATLTASCSVISLSTDATSVVLPSGITQLEVRPSLLTADCRKIPGLHQRGDRSDAVSTPAGLSMLIDLVASRSSLISRSIPASASSTSATLRSKASGSPVRSPGSSRMTPIMAARAFPRSNRKCHDASSPPTAADQCGRWASPNAYLYELPGWRRRDSHERQMSRDTQIGPLPLNPARSRGACHQSRSDRWTAITPRA